MRLDWEASEAALESSQKMPLHPSALGIAPPVPGRVKGAGMASISPPRSECTLWLR